MASWITSKLSLLNAGRQSCGDDVWGISKYVISCSTHWLGDSVTGHVSKFGISFFKSEDKKTWLCNHLKLLKLEKMAEVCTIYFKMWKFPLSHIHGVFRLVQTFMHYKEKQDLLKTTRNDKIMTNQSLWAPHSALLCGLGGGRHWDSEEELDSVKTLPRLIKSHEGWWK